MKQIILLGNEYEIINDKHKCFALDEVQNLITDYFEPYDYVLGDFSYGKLRLKGFYDSKNKKVTKINNFCNIESYINDFCSYQCKYFIIKKNKKNII